MSRERKRKKKERQQRARAGQKIEFPPIPIDWPPEDLPDDQWTMGMHAAVLLHPMVVGLGGHPRIVADEDYVAACLQVIERHGTRHFADAMLRVLKRTVDHPWTLANSPVAGQAVPAPIPATCDLKLPMTRVEIPGQRNTPDNWTAGMVIGLLLNPATTGIWPFKQVISDSEWVGSFTRMLNQDGVAQTLVDFIYVLRFTYGSPGVAAGGIPPGCVFRDDTGMPGSPPGASPE